VFEQIRPNQDYDYVLCFGLAPNNAMMWILSKNDIIKNINLNNITKQHPGGETFWINPVPINNIPLWMSEYGGDLSYVINNIKSNNF
jgi:hypothetical protein